MIYKHTYKHTNIFIYYFQELAKTHEINITATYSIADFIPEKKAEMEEIVRKSMPITRGNTYIYLFIYFL